MFFISIKKHNRIVNDLHASYVQKIEDLEKENESKRWNWLKEKSSYTSNLERENKGLKDNNKYLSEDNTALRLEIGLLKENVGDYKALKDELKLAKNSIGGFKSNSTKKTKIICELKILIKEKDTIIKDLKVKGASSALKQGTKVKNIRLLYDVTDGHDIDCKIDGFGAMKLKSSVVKKI